MNSKFSSSLIFIFYLLPIFHTSPLPSLLALNCTPKNHQSFDDDNSTLSFLIHLTYEAQKTHFATFKSNQFTGFMQCRLDLNQPNCSFCIKYAKNTILRLCPNSTFVVAWFNGCYIKYSQNNNNNNIQDNENNTTITNVFNYSCSTKPPLKDRAHYDPALETLLLYLRAEVTHRWFAYGELTYGKNGGKIYGMVDCLRVSTAEECDSCVGKGIERVEEQCGGRVGGFVVVDGLCLVWHESFKFFLDSIIVSSTSGSRTIFKDGEKGNRVTCLREKNLLFLGIVAVFIVGLVAICGCLVSRSIMNVAKVGNIEGDQ